MNRKSVCVVGAGWAGLAAAIGAVQAGHRVTVLEATRSFGGRARALEHSPAALLPDGSFAPLDNGQHILIGGYQETLKLLRLVGVEPQDALLRVPLCLQFADTEGLVLPDWPQPWNLLAGVLSAGGWSLSDKWSLISALRRWKKRGFQCTASATVAELSVGLNSTVVDTLIVPLCFSALNTPPQQASGQVFLTVLHDALLARPGDANPAWPALASSDLLLPRVDLSSLFPKAAAHWLEMRGATLRPACRAQAPQWNAGRWRVADGDFDAVIWATGAQHAVQAFGEYAPRAPKNLSIYLKRWLRVAQSLKYQAIATVYAHATRVTLPKPIMALRSSPVAPAQCVFDRGQLGGPEGLLAFVVSACTGTCELVQQQVLAQGNNELADYLQAQLLTPVQTIIEKRATFSCTAGLRRPPQRVAPGLLACGDYLYAPYPATLEGAVRSGMMAALALSEDDGFSWKA